MKKNLVFYLLLHGHLLCAQETAGEKPAIPVSADSGVLYNATETEPAFKGDWVAFLVKNIVYPPKAFQKNIQGMVQINFIVEINGTVTNLAVSETSEQKNMLLVKEAIRVLKRTGRNWIPGMLNGKPVRTMHTQNVHFSIGQ